MKTIKEMEEILAKANLESLSILDKNTKRIYKYGEHPYYDMQIENYILCPEGRDDWFGFRKSDYKLIL